MIIQRTPTEGKRLCTVDLLIKVTCFVKKVNNVSISKEVDLNYLV
jgi:hypothetical protein